MLGWLAARLWPQGLLAAHPNLLAFGLIAAVLGALTAALSGSSPLEIALWALADGLGAAGVTAFAAAEQTRERVRLTRLVQTVLATLALATLLLTVAVAAGWLTLSLPQETSLLVPAVAAALGLVLLIVELLAARRRLDQIRRARLVSGGSLVAGMQGAMYALDFGLVRDIVVERAAVERGHVNPTPGRGVGLQALLWRDLQRLTRFPRPLVGLAASAAATAVRQAIGACRVPRHANELRPVMSEVSRPPALRVCHQLAQIVLQRFVVELPEFFAIAESRFERIGLGRVLVQQVDAQLVGPPGAALCATTGSVVDRAFAGGLVVGLRVHDRLRFLVMLWPCLPSRCCGSRRALHVRCFES